MKSPLIMDGNLRQDSLMSILPPSQAISSRCVSGILSIPKLLRGQRDNSQCQELGPVAISNFPSSHGLRSIYSAISKCQSPTQHHETPLFNTLHLHFNESSRPFVLFDRQSARAIAPMKPNFILLYSRRSTASRRGSVATLSSYWCSTDSRRSLGTRNFGLSHNTR